MEATVHIIIQICLKRICNKVVFAEQELVHPKTELHGQIETEWDQSTRLELWICSWSLFFDSLNTRCPQAEKQNSEPKTTRADVNRVRSELEIRAVNLFMVAFLQLTKYKMSLRPRNRTPNPELHGQMETEWDQSTRLELWICSWSLFFISLNRGCASGREKTARRTKRQENTKTSILARGYKSITVHLFYLNLKTKKIKMTELQLLEDYFPKLLQKIGI